MNRMLFSIFLLLTAVTVHAFDLDSLQSGLDYAIENRAVYESAKLKRVDSLRLAGNHYALFEEYQSYICDSALFYINLDIIEKSKQGREADVWFSQIKKAQVLSVSGLYLEALEQLQQIPSSTLDSVSLTQYYKAYADLYLYLAEYASEDEFKYKYLSLMDVYQDSILNTGGDEFLIFTTQASRLLSSHRYSEARYLLEDNLKTVNKHSRDYAILTSTLSFVCHLLEDYSGERAYLILSATADVEAVVKENKSLRSLAELLYNDGNLQKADYYMQISMEDANFYNARLRNVQVSKMLPVINRAYSDVEKNRKTLLIAVVVLLSLILVIMVFVVVYVRKQNNKLNVAREKLQEANNIKEEYLARFLELCPIYIDSVEKYRKTLNKKASSGKMEDVLTALKQNNITDSMQKEFYNMFDEAFLKIYPDFVDKFNSMLPDAEKILPKETGKLTTELRIYALIRLGITDSGKIAEFLHFSITTIYTYRSKIKNKSLSPDDFEQKVSKI
ncbi:MAG: DUF6377 domain-containing protein [Paludibacteraceae bacterium]|nr:DUF6377 domain-containing protein [Paludibacteraceae bacterium]